MSTVIARSEIWSLSVSPPDCYFSVVVGLVWSHDPETYTCGSVATGRASHAGEVTQITRDTWTSRLGLCVGLTTPLHKKYVLLRSFWKWKPDGQFWKRLVSTTDCNARSRKRRKVSVGILRYECDCINMYSTLHSRAASLFLSLQSTSEFTIIEKTTRNASFQFEKFRSHLRPIY
jgi:hypothetical protein